MLGRATLLLACGLIACNDATASNGNGCDVQMKAGVKLAHVLWSLVLYEESYFADSITYTANVSTPQLSYWYAYPNGFQAVPGVRLTIGNVSAQGWRASAVDDAANVRCQVFVGSGPQEIAGTSEGVPVCEAW